MKVKDVMHKGVDWVSPNTPVTELAKLMREHDIGCIPIGEDDRLIGMVTDRDIVCKGLASNNFDARRAMARDVMTEGIHCCREDDQLIGMVTDRDIVCKGLASNNFDARRAMARDVMTEGIHCCREDDDLAKAVHHMETLKVRRLPVINKNKRMVGMISLGDVSHSAPGNLLSECVKSVSTHH
jgi:CBS domain-containing protein